MADPQAELYAREMPEQAAEETVADTRVVMEAIARWCDRVADVIEKKENRMREG